MGQLFDLSLRYPDQLVKKVTVGGGKQEDYVPWHTTVQRLLATVGPFSWRVVQVTDSHEEREPVAVIGELSVTIDGVYTTVAGVGQGVDAKNAESEE